LIKPWLEEEIEEDIEEEGVGVSSPIGANES
jgi:hypothetical protein